MIVCSGDFFPGPHADVPLCWQLVPGAPGFA